MTGLAGEAARTAGPDIRVLRSRISAIGKLTPQAHERQLDATGCVVYPGWINTHHHLAQCVLKGVPAGLNVPLIAWLAAVPHRYRDRYDESLLRLAAEIGIAELVLSGTTTIADHHYTYLRGMNYDPAELLFDVANKFGVRFVFCRGGVTTRPDFEENNPNLPEVESAEGIIEDVERLVNRYHDVSGSSMRRVVMAPVNPIWAVKPAELMEMARAARRMGIHMHSHLSETVDSVTFCRERFGIMPVEFVAEHEWLGPDVWFAHMVHVSDPEIRMMGETGTGVAHCPASNCRLGSGIAPATLLAAAGVPMSFGGDGPASNESADMLSEVHTAWYLHRACKGARALAVEDVVRWGTSGGARVLGLKETGAIAPGLCADIAVYQLDDLRYAGLHDIAIGPVASGGRPKLKYLLVQGAVVVENDAIPGLDTKRLMARAREAVKKLMG